MRLAGKSAIITGAASGMGRAMALLFAKEGADVAVLEIDAAGARAVGAEVQAAGRSALAISCDVSDAAQVGDELTLRRLSLFDGV